MEGRWKVHKRGSECADGMELHRLTAAAAGAQVELLSPQNHTWAQHEPASRPCCAYATSRSRANNNTCRAAGLGCLGSRRAPHPGSTGTAGKREGQCAAFTTNPWLWLGSILILPPSSISPLTSPSTLVGAVLVAPPPFTCSLPPPAATAAPGPELAMHRVHRCREQLPAAPNQPTDQHTWRAVHPPATGASYPPAGHSRSAWHPGYRTPPAPWSADQGGSSSSGSVWSRCKQESHGIVQCAHRVKDAGTEMQLTGIQYQWHHPPCSGQVGASTGTAPRVPRPPSRLARPGGC